MKIDNFFYFFDFQADSNKKKNKNLCPEFEKNGKFCASFQTCQYISKLANNIFLKINSYYNSNLFLTPKFTFKKKLQLVI